MKSKSCFVQWREIYHPPFKSLSNERTPQGIHSSLPKLLFDLPDPLRLRGVGAPLLHGKLIGTPLGDILRLVVREKSLESLLDDPATDVIQDHDRAHGDLKLGVERHEAELLVDLRDELGGAAESDAGDHEDAVVHALVFPDGLAEGTALVVDGEGRDLLDELQEVNGAVEERGLELALEVDGPAIFHGLELLDEVGDVDESGDVDGELTEDRGNDVPVPDVVLRALLGKLLDGLKHC